MGAGGVGDGGTWTCKRVVELKGGLDLIDPIINYLLSNCIVLSEERIIGTKSSNRYMVQGGAVLRMDYDGGAYSFYGEHFIDDERARNGLEKFAKDLGFETREVGS
ncbi:hypothetical protein J4423_00275 [Candidatus Pacearchaeota archaeon]|nr:hypothetical protein [Candidatus Pacearchaeota archaeon]